MKTIPALLLVLALGGCAVATPPPDNFHRLSSPTEVTTLAKPLNGTIEVTRPSAEGLAADRALVYSYRDQPNSVQRYGYELWSEPPAALVQQQVIECLRTAKAARMVVSADLGAVPDYTVKGRVHRFEQVVAGQAAVALVEAELAVTRLRDDRILLLKTYRVEQPAADIGVPAAVRAFDQALAQVCRAFAADLAAAQGR